MSRLKRSGWTKANRERDKSTWKRRARLAQVSPQRKASLDAYTRAVKAAKEGSRVCQRCSCHTSNLDAHHPYGRTNQWLHVFVLVCRKCHDEIHANPKQAREEGWLQPEYGGYVRHESIRYPTPWLEIHEPPQSRKQHNGSAQKKLEAMKDSLDWSLYPSQLSKLAGVSPTSVALFMTRNGIPVKDGRKCKNKKNKTNELLQ